jgi:hypothetical protein
VIKLERPSKPANELEGLIRDLLPDPVRRHLLDVHIDRMNADVEPNWIGRAVWDPKASHDDQREFSDAMNKVRREFDLLTDD